MQFHVRDAAAADEDLRELLAGDEAAAALLFTCNGRGRHLFGAPDHDAGVRRRSCSARSRSRARSAPARSGPVGGRNFLHGFTASLALFDGRERSSDAPGTTADAARLTVAGSRGGG